MSTELAKGLTLNGNHSKLPQLPEPRLCLMWSKLLLTHWGRVTYTCVGNLTIIGPDNGLSPGRRQAIIWTNAGILLIGPWGTNVSEILIGIHTFSFKKINLKMSSAKWRPFCLGLNMLTYRGFEYANNNSVYICVILTLHITTANPNLPLNPQSLLNWLPPVQV